jgi:hypothetical protein
MYHESLHLVNPPIGLHQIPKFSILETTKASHSNSHKYRSIIVMGANLRSPGEQTASVGELVDAVAAPAALSGLTSRMALAAEITPAP